MNIEEHAQELKNCCREYLPEGCKGCPFDEENGYECKLRGIPIKWKVEGGNSGEHDKIN